MREKPSGSDEEDGYEDIPTDFKVVNSIEKEPLAKIEKIGDMTPVQDFEAMMSRRDSADWIAKALKDMQNKIVNLVENSQEGNNYFAIAMECLVALRKGCILEQVCLSV